MDWFGWLRPKRSSPPRRPPKVVSGVFIDVPNVVNRRYGSAADYFRVAWQTLREHIEKDSKGTLCTFRKAYSSIDPTTENRKALITREERHWLTAKYKFVNDPDGDIDLHIRKDLEEWVAASVARHQGARMRIVLISGDGGYLESILPLMEKYPNMIDLYVWAWREGLHKSYLDYTSRERIRYFNDYPDAFVRNTRVL